MGMFDTVYVPCQCGGRAEVQTKAGECTLRDYDAERGVPAEIAADLNGQTATCRDCGAGYELLPTVPIDRVVMLGRRL